MSLYLLLGNIVVVMDVNLNINLGGTKRKRQIVIGTALVKKSQQTLFLTVYQQSY